MDEVRIFIESSQYGTGRVKKGVGMWLVEEMKDGVPCTKKGFVHGENITGTELTLKALVNTFSLNMFKEPHDALIYCSCATVLHAFQYSWYAQWQKNGWVKQDGKPVKYQDLWQMLSDRMWPHVCAMRGGTHEYTKVMQNDIRRKLEEWQKASSKNTPAR